MKRLFATLLLFFAGSSAADVTLSPGQSASVSCVSVGTVVVVPPVVTPPPPPPVVPPPTVCQVATGGFSGVTLGPCIAGGLWVAGHNRLSTGPELHAGDSVEGEFTVPAGWSGTVELGISGANLKAFIDGREYIATRTDITTGRHVVKILATATASGSVDLYHY